MRFPVIPTLFLLLLAMSAAVIVPNAVVLLPERAALVRQLSAGSGLDVHVAGEMRLRFLPRPQLLLEDVSAQLAGDAAQGLRSARLVINVAPLDLLQKKITVRGVHFINADVTLVSEAGVTGLMDTLLRFTHPHIGFSKSRFRISGLDRYDRSAVMQAGGLSIDLPARQAGDDFAVHIRQVRADRADAQFSLRVGRLALPRQDVSLRLALAPDESVGFDGFVTRRAGDWRADGEMRVDSAAMLAMLLQTRLPITLLPSSQRIALSGLVQADRSGMRSENLEITAMNSVFQSRLALDWPQTAEQIPQLRGRLSTGVVNLDTLSLNARPIIARAGDVAAIWQAFERQLGVALRIEATRFDIGGESGQNLLLAFDWQDEAIQVQRFSVDLPFRSLFLASGKFDLSTAMPAFQGNFSTRSTDALAAVLWLSELAGIDSARLIEGLDESRLQRVSLVGDVLWSPEKIELDAMSGRLGDDRLTADLHFARGDAMQGKLDLEIERLDLADWGAVTATASSERTLMGALFTPLNKSLGGLLQNQDKGRNLRLDISTQKLFSGVTELGPAAFTAQLANQTLILQRLELSDFAGLSLAAGGRMNYATTPPSGVMSAQLQGEGALPPMLAGLLPVQPRDDTRMDLAAKWTLSAPDAADWPNATLRGAGTLDTIQTRFTLTGPARRIAFDEKGQKLDLTLQGRANDIATLSNIGLPYDDDALGSARLQMENQSSNVTQIKTDIALRQDALSLVGQVRRTAGGRRIAGTLSFRMADILPLLGTGDGPQSLSAQGDVQIVSDPDSLAFSALDATIGEGKVSGEGVVNLTADRPKLNANLKADGLSLDWALPNYGAAGWSDAPMKWSAFARSDVDVELGGTNLRFGQFAVEDVTARLKLLGGVLEAPQITGRAMGGTFEVELLAEGGMLNPYFSVQSRFADIRPTPFLASVYGVGPFMAPLSGSLVLSGRGTSARDMMGSLGGEMQFELGGGVLRFINASVFTALAAAETFEGRAISLLQRPDVQGETPFARGIGLIDIRDGQAIRSTLDLVFDADSALQEGRFSGQFDFVSRALLADFALSPEGSNKELLWQLSGDITAPEIRVDAAAFDRVAPPIEAASPSALPHSAAPN